MSEKNFVVNKSVSAENTPLVTDTTLSTISETIVGSFSASAYKSVDIDIAVEQDGGFSSRSYHGSVKSGVVFTTQYASLDVKRNQYTEAPFTKISVINNPVGQNIYGIKFGNNLFIAHGAYGQIKTSTDAITWTTRTSNFGNENGGNVKVLAFGNNLWVAAGYQMPSGVGGIRTSTDGTTWTTRTSNFGTYNSATAIGFGNGLFVIGVNHQNPSNGIRTSADGVTWTTRTSNFAEDYTGNIEAIAYGNVWVAAGAYGNIRTSTDAITWTTRTSNFGNYSIDAVAYGNNLWVAGGGNGQIRTSTDAITWVTRTSNLPNDYTGIIESIAYGNGLWVANSNINTGVVATSTDAITWTTRKITASALATQFYGIIHANNKFYMGSYSYTDVISSSSLNTEANIPLTIKTDYTPIYNQRESNLGGLSIKQLSYGSNLWVIASSAGNIRTSTDAITWTTRTSNFGNTNIRTVSWGNNLWVAAGYTGQLRTSTDGTTWTTRTSTFGNTQIETVAYGNNLWVAAGYAGQLRTSTDAITWTTRTSNFGATNIRNVAYGNNLWAAGGYNGQIRTSTDGTTWTTRTSNFGATQIVGIAYGNNLWVAVGGNGTVRSSTDAITWTTRSLPWTETVAQAFASLSLNSVEYGNGLFSIGANFALSFVSTDAVTWTSKSPIPNSSVNTALISPAHGNGKLVIGFNNYASPYDSYSIDELESDRTVTVTTKVDNAIISPAVVRTSIRKIL